MNWRKIQLGSELCDQDRLILNLVGHDPVKIHGGPCEGFANYVQLDDQSSVCLIFFNRPLWLSEILDLCAEYLSQPTSRLYIGINRYQVKGNDTLLDYKDLIDNNIGHGHSILKVVSQHLSTLGFRTIKMGCLENDQGKYFNFVQPLTWVYAEHETYQSN
jgi:hypothetical protein